MSYLYFVRHGESTWNVAGRLQGQTMDVPLTERGISQAHAVAGQLRDLVAPGVALIASDQKRACDTAQIIAEVLDTTVQLDARLREQAMGELEGLLTSELRAQDVPEGSHISEIAWGGGESIQQVHARCQDFLADVPDGDVVVVSHGDTLRVMLAALAGKTHRDVDWVPIANTEVVIHERREG